MVAPFSGQFGLSNFSFMSFAGLDSFTNSSFELGLLTATTTPLPTIEEFAAVEERILPSTTPINALSLVTKLGFGSEELSTNQRHQRAYSPVFAYNFKVGNY